MTKRYRVNIVLFLFVLSTHTAVCQLSPGDLSAFHSHLEGISNCTQCHVLGNKVSDDKCLLCHTEIKEKIALAKGYHSSSAVRGKQCFTCHSEHNGKNFILVKLDISKFDHSLTGYNLSEPHSRKLCKDCHSSQFISDPKAKSKKFTYTGLKTECLTCHADYHQQTLSQNCLSCHDEKSFKPVTKFNHDQARFKLNGKHKVTDCSKCHKEQLLNGKKFQEFRGMQFSKCTDCHKDPHRNQFGQNCTQCHSEESFLAVKGTKNFNHDKTGFKLEDKHQLVTCKQCHKTKYTDPLKHDKCTDCHKDYHKGQFAKNGKNPDCSLCHNLKGFNLFSYTIEQHNSAVFPLNGSHLAVPCTDCHKKQENWSFRQIGIKCSDCHPDIHKNYISQKFYPGQNCVNCHNESGWHSVKFDHSRTSFSLSGAHLTAGCKACHFKKDDKGTNIQKFTGLKTDCSSCHKDNHNNQFGKNGVTVCTDCHGTDNWKASRFNHDNTAFRLDGKHINVACVKCHKQVTEGGTRFILYKIKEYKCESCHF
jgi:hypothetical protein